MPWLPLAILLVVALTIAALALILFPPGEAGDDRPDEDDATDFASDEATEEDFSPPPVGGDHTYPLRGEGEEPLSESEPSPDLGRRPS